MNAKELAALQADARDVFQLAVRRAYEAEREAVVEAQQTRQEAIADANRWYEETLRKA